jgi:hypothetical protein
MQFRTRRPRAARHWLAIAVVVVTLLLGLWPTVALFNTEQLIFGLPALVTWSVIVTVLTSAAMVIVNALKVHGTDEVPALGCNDDAQEVESP